MKEKSLFKFRAWEKNMNEMIPVENIDFLAKQINTNSVWRMFHEIELMQSTGLKDKKGVEIYEGDYLSLIVFEANKEYKGEVVFSKGSFCLTVQIKGHEYTVPFHEMSEVYNLLEVLGNIHENPEFTEVQE